MFKVRNGEATSINVPRDPFKRLSGSKAPIKSAVIRICEFFW